MQLPGLHIERPIDVENIEELFSLASADEGKALHKDMRMAIAATLDCCRTLAGSPPRRGQIVVKTKHLEESSLGSRGWKAKTGETGFAADRSVFEVPLHGLYTAAMLGILGNSGDDTRNTFISFNYDLVLEEALRFCSLTVDYGIARNSLTALTPWVTQGHGIQVLKLHGSLNWAFPGQRGKRMTAYDSYEAVRNAGLVPVLIPPTWRKDFGYDQIDQVWRSAVTALRTATRVIVIGFSMPPNDLHFRYLVSAGLRQNISLRAVTFVDPNIERVAERALTVLRPELVRLGVLSFLGLRAKEFLVSRPYLSAIGRPAEVSIDVFPMSEQLPSVPRWA